MENDAPMRSHSLVGAPLGTIDYSAMGFRSGLEIHQQLVSKKKLFCHCPAVYVKGPHDGEIYRHMRPTMSELGEYDGTALMEFKTKKNVTYQIFHHQGCTYEFDDTPPFPLNQEALDIAIHLSLLFDCSIVDEVHVSRKQYLDGSIPAGFQRTMIVSIEGGLPFEECGNGRRIGIIQCALEEDACREVSDEGHNITFRTDRLSIPLVEIVTYPDMLTPQEVRAVAEKLGRWMRSTGLVRRGLGATRQDVNVSITGGTRVEIKGVPKLDWIPILVHNEALRQWSLLELKRLLADRGLSPDYLDCQSVDVTGLLQTTGYQPIRKAIEEGDRVGAVALRGFKGLLEHATQPGMTFADELAGRIRVIACLDGVPNLIHSDRFPTQGWSISDADAVGSTLNATDGDAVVIVWGNAMDVQNAIKEILERCKEAFEGVPKETRQAFANGITDFERILPGPDRMYPDTDIPPSVIDDDRVSRIRSALTVTPDDLETQALAAGVPPHVARPLSIHPRRMSFLRAMSAGADPKAAAVVIVEDLKYLRRRGVPVDNIEDARLEDLLNALSDGEMFREVLGDILRLMAENQTITWKEALGKLGLEPVDTNTIVRTVEEAIQKARSSTHRSESSICAMMGEAMTQLAGRASGAKVYRVLNEHLEATKRPVLRSL